LETGIRAGRDQISPNEGDEMTAQSQKIVGIVLGAALSAASTNAAWSQATEAPTGFDNRTNGFLEQGPPFEELNEDTVVARRSFNDNRFIFEEIESIADGVGPTFNAQSCRECHQNVVTGGASQITELRCGQAGTDGFREALGGSLIQSRATHPDIVERVGYNDDVRTLRLSTNTLGSGFVESIADDTLKAIRDAQPDDLRGTIVMAPVLEDDDRPRVGRFGWKSQHASLHSFAADAYFNEMGITTPFFPKENTSNGRDVSAYDLVPDSPNPEDDGVDALAFADFMRSTKAPPRGPITSAVLAGERHFKDIGCASCHTPSITTAPKDTPINGGTFHVPAALASKIIHPYSDFLLHDIGSGDGIPATPDQPSTANQIRTAPLWGVRTRNRLMHDGVSLTYKEAINRHAGQATRVKQAFDSLPRQQQVEILTFLNSL
jgi:CxxC motif-containing protein (DUF1111 family)